MIGALVQLSAISRSGWALSWVLVLVYALPLCVLIYRLDLYEREPISLAIGAFLWGALAATALALDAAGWDQLVARVLGQDVATRWGPALTAPLIEEALTGVGVVLIYLIARDEVDDVMDGFVYGALCGLGFAVQRGRPVAPADRSGDQGPPPAAHGGDRRLPGSRPGAPLARPVAGPRDRARGDLGGGVRDAPQPEAPPARHRRHATPRRPTSGRPAPAAAARAGEPGDDRVPQRCARRSGRRPAPRLLPFAPRRARGDPRGRVGRRRAARGAAVHRRIGSPPMEAAAEVEELVAGVLAGDRRAVARAISLVEDGRAELEALSAGIYASTGP